MLVVNTIIIIIIIRHFISLEPAFWATLPPYSSGDCTVGGSKEGQGMYSTVVCSYVIHLLSVVFLMLARLHCASAASVLFGAVVCPLLLGGSLFCFVLFGARPRSA